MKILLLIPLLFTHLVASAETDLWVGAAEILGYGVFQPREMGKRLPRDASRVGVDGIIGGTFQTYTRDIEAKLELVFGIEYMINSSPRGLGFPVRQVLIPPEPGLQSPRGKRYREMQEKLDVLIGEKTFFGYGFDEPWEMVPGEWTFQVWYKDFKLVEESFTVTVRNDTSGLTEPGQVQPGEGVPE